VLYFSHKRDIRAILFSPEFVAIECPQSCPVRAFYHGLRYELKKLDKPFVNIRKYLISCMALDNCDDLGEPFKTWPRSCLSSPSRFSIVRSIWVGQSETLSIVEAPIGSVATSTVEFKNQTLTISRGGKEDFPDF
jgi:hypothetical protein